MKEFVKMTAESLSEKLTITSAEKSSIGTKEIDGKKVTYGEFVVKCKASVAAIADYSDPLVLSLSGEDKNGVKYGGFLTNGGVYTKYTGGSSGIFNAVEQQGKSNLNFFYTQIGTAMKAGDEIQIILPNYFDPRYCTRIVVTAT